jgi:hypothetical protein
MTSSYSPLSSERYAISFPSGDQAGPRSCAPGVAVRYRGSPFSAGTVTISPRNSSATRAPEGEIEPSRAHFAPFAQRGRVSRRSAFTVIGRGAAFFVAGVEEVEEARLLVDELPLAAAAARTGKSSWP